MTSAQREQRRFNSIVYSGSFLVTHNFKDLDLLRMASLIDNTFSRFIGDKLGKGTPNDYVSVIIQHNELSRDINVTSRVRNFCTEEIVNRIYKVAQSNSSWLLEGTFNIDVMIFRQISSGNWKTKLKTKPETISQKEARKHCIVTIKNKDNACGYWAVALGMLYYQLERHIFRRKNGRRTNQSKEEKRKDCLWHETIKEQEINIKGRARRICREAGLNYEERLSTENLHLLDAYLQPRGYQLYVVQSTDCSVLHEGPDAARQIYLLRNERTEHINLITSITAWMEVNEWCHKCWKGNTRPNRHNCTYTCPRCRQFGVCKLEEGEDEVTCDDCHRRFLGEVCFSKHKDAGVCSSYLKCPDCEKEYEAEADHQCNKVWCKQCHMNEDSPHYHYIQQKSVKKLQKEDKELKIIVAFDIESELKKIGDTYEHRPNLLIAHVNCDECFDQETFLRRLLNCDRCGEARHVWSGYDCVKKFNDYILAYLGKQAHLKGRVYVFAHNFQRYDGQFVYRDLFDRDLATVEPVMVGNKLLKIDINNVRYLDSLCFFQQKLANLPKSFGFDKEGGIVIAKGDFPYLFNTEERLNYVGSWPEKKYYGYDSKTTNEKQEFDRWFSTVCNSTFKLQEELEKYCDTDVKILMQAVQRFRALFKSQTGLDPISRSFTLASIGLETYRANFLRDGKTLAITPISGYSGRKNSHKGHSWLDLQQKVRGIKIHREALRGPYVADGAFENTVFEYWG